MLRRVFALATIAMALPAALAAQDSANAPEKKRLSRDPQIIRQNEIEAEVDARNALELIQRLRPFWIRNRGQSSVNLGTADPVVYVNNTRMGPPSVLQQYSTTSIREIRQLRGTEASMRFGMGHENGAILLTLR
jgi:hypothetical protein